MRILRQLGISIALALIALVAHAAEDPAAGVSAPEAATAETDEPDAINALVAPTTQPDASVGIANDATRDLISVAAHEIETGEYADAEIQLARLVGQLEQQSSHYDPSLVVPLTLLGDALSGEAKYQEAMYAYEQADHITRITDGLHSTDQVEIVYREANTLASMGKIDKANDRQEYAYETLAREYGAFAPGLVPGLFHLAAWYDRTSNIFAARGLYEHAVRILSATYGDNDPSLIPALRGLAYTYREEHFPPYRVSESTFTNGASAGSTVPTLSDTMAMVTRFDAGEAALRDVVKITEANPNAKPIDLARAELDLADWCVLFDRQARAVPVYVQARHVMRDRAGLNDDEIAVYFGAPMLLYLPVPANPPKPTLALRGSSTDGYVELGYTVTEQGVVNELKTLASEPAGLMDTKIRHSMHVARFRPRFEGDSPVASPNQVYRHAFVYYPHSAPPSAAAERRKEASKAGTPGVNAAAQPSG